MPACPPPSSSSDRRGGAALARLHHTSDADPGIRRVRAGRGFTYRDPDGRPVDADTRAWIRGLAIPPAWTDVWISPDRDGHLQATGRDARGRKQYRYHPAFRRRRDDREVRAASSTFGAALPRIRAPGRRATWRRPGLPREKVARRGGPAAGETLIRVGNERVRARTTARSG